MKRYEIEYYTSENGSMMCRDFFTCEPEDAAETALGYIKEFDGFDYAYVTDEREDTFGIDKGGFTF